mmetsp:Transcript_3393/g.3753  ORF Transcript_3393/g.3753 Transcript_3393/m.3753 type:complete len:139 (+) Transcript_3393:80-496(+)
MIQIVSGTLVVTEACLTMIKRNYFETKINQQSFVSCRIGVHRRRKGFYGLGFNSEIQFRVAILPRLRKRISKQRCVTRNIDWRFVLESAFSFALQAESANGDAEARKLNIVRMKEFVLHSLVDQYYKRLAKKTRKENA